MESETPAGQSREVEVEVEVEEMRVRVRSRSASESESETSCSSSSDSSSESSDFEEGGDAMLGGLRLGMRTIRKYARKELGKCSTVVGHEDLRRRLESSTLRLVQGERMFLETSRIVAGVVDDMCSDPEVPPSDEEDENGNPKIGPSRLNVNHNQDKPRPSLPTPGQLALDQTKMAQLFESRMENFAETLSKENLRFHPQFVALEKEIRKGEADFNRKSYSSLDEFGIPEEEEQESSPRPSG